jgi:hypothetical protein
MKTLLITGIYNHSSKLGIYNVNYKVDLFGQSDTDHTLVLITNQIFKNFNYDQLIDHCKKIYCKYFNCDDFNIITLTSLEEHKFINI